MSDPFENVIQRDIAEKCSVDACGAVIRNMQLCDTQKAAVVVAVAGVAGAMSALVGAFYATYPDELTPEIVDVFWQDMMRQIVLEASSATIGPCAAARADIARKPAK